MAFEIDSGYKSVFYNATPPLNWTKSTADNNCALRVVTGAASTGGSVNFSDVHILHTLSASSINQTGTWGPYTLVAADLPSHYHGYTNAGPGFPVTLNTGTPSPPVVTGVGSVPTSSAGSDVAHTHPIGGTWSFSGSDIDLRIGYVDMIIATRD